MTPPQADKGEDLWVWGGEQNGQFSIKSAYKIVCELDDHQLLDPWKAVWGWKGPNRVRFFFWLVSHDKLLTNLSRLRRQLSTDASCGLCHCQEESTIHILRECTVAVEVWKQLKSMFWARSVRTALARDELVAENRGERRGADIAWDPGPEDWVTLNTDGSVEATRRRAAAGGLLRNTLGRCLMAFTMNLGHCSITRAEIRGAIEGLSRTWDAGFRKVILQLDSKAAIVILTNKDDNSHQRGLEVVQFRELCQRDWLVEIKHTYREGNHAADFLASIGYGYPFGSHTVSVSDSRLVYFLRYDCMGITEHRSILIND
ncbi:Putative ribonuclease H protein At1g65750 [Linum perenne]